MTAQAPPTWLEDLATADTSWIFDATGSSFGRPVGFGLGRLNPLAGLVELDGGAFDLSCVS